ncbi:uncharacterized protein METZ01_LOCUS214092 [marine metagenome]|uniref:Uncharacterized protein n=1 Tax=marine metagenome TaxID=408172 RepID=A0A382FDQ6_9ZZZZ
MSLQTEKTTPHRESADGQRASFVNITRGFTITSFDNLETVALTGDTNSR